MLFAVLAPLIIALFIPTLSKLKEKIHTGIFVFFVPFAIFLYFIQFVGKDFTPVRQIYNWIPSLHINFDFYLDGLSLLFVLLISGIGSLVVLYSIYYLDKTERLGQFYVYLLMFMAAMLGIVLSDNIYVLYTFWELTSISSFLLIGYWHFKERSRYGALKSMMITIFGGLSMLGGFILLSVITNTTSIREMIAQADIILQSEYIWLVLIFILLGAFTKSAQFPFHIWLPDAMEAPTPVSAYLHSATMVKAGIYLVARFSPIFSNYDWFFIVVSTFGIVTLCWGSYMAVRQTDLKAILAFSTISQLGMIMAMLGFGTNIAVFAAVFHILNHATFKGSLFMVAGIIDVQTGTRDIRRLGALYTLMPISGTLALFGTFSMAGFPLPFLNGFYSKELFFDATLQLEQNGLSFSSVLTTLIPYLAVFGSIFTFVYSIYLFFGVFGRKKDKSSTLPIKPKEAKIGMLISPIVLVAGVIIIGLVPNLFNGSLITHAATSIKDTAVYDSIQFWHGFNTPLIMSLIVVVIGAILYVTKEKWENVYKAVPGNLSFNRVYDRGLTSIDETSKKITQFYMNGSIRNYMLLIVGTMFVVSFIFMYATNGFSISFSDLAEITIIEVVVVIAIAIAAIGTIFSNHNVAAILILGITGYGVAILFVLYRAPDLALTQLVIETITVVLFLLCFYHFPKLRKRTESAGKKTVNLIVSVGFGAMMTMIALASFSTTNGFDKISEYFIETALPIGGGRNIVNVILVDMRGIDTLFEIAVLGLAGLTVFSLIKLRNDKGAK